MKHHSTATAIELETQDVTATPINTSALGPGVTVKLAPVCKVAKAQYTRYNMKLICCVFICIHRKL